jgi:hypothetical protein
VLWNVQVTPAAAACEITTGLATRNGATMRRAEPTRRAVSGAGDARADALSDAWREKHGADDARGPCPHPCRQDHTGRWSAEGRAMEAWRRRYTRNGYRSLTALGSGTIGGMDGRAYLRALVAREEAEGIAPAVVEEARQAVRAAITQRDVARLCEKGLLPRGGESAS